MKRCAHCRERFEPRFSTLTVVCSPECGLAWAKGAPDRAEKHRKRAAALERREYREKAETPSQAAANAQRVFNAWVRMRDAGRPCVSCNYPDDGTRQRHASHYRPAGSNPALRFDEANVHAACSICNNYMSGNLIGYRAALVIRIGWDEVERLEGPHELPHRTVEDFRAIQRYYAARIRAMKARDA